MTSLWTQKTEKDFFSRALKCTSREQLFYKTDDNRYVAYWPKGYKGKKTTLQSRNSRIGNFTEKWSVELLKKYADQGNPINLQIVNLAEETPVSDIYKILSNAPDEALSVAGKRLKELNTSGLIPNDVLNQIATMRQQIDKNEFILKDLFNIYPIYGTNRIKCRRNQNNNS